MASVATMLHISDLHFVKELTEKGRKLLRKSPTLAVKPHAFSRIDKLSAQIFALELAGEPVDLLLVTGDVSTDGSTGALSTAHNFLETKGDIFRGNPKRIVTQGLGFPIHKRVVIPGNHDRYAGRKLFFQRRSGANNLENIFQISTLSEHYPYLVGYRREDKRNDQNAPALLFFVFDSTIPPTGKPSVLHKIACGGLEEAECRWLVTTAKQLMSKQEVLGLDGKSLPINFDNCIRIAVLHHHPLIDKALEKNLSDKAGLTLMDNHETFVDYCFQAGIDIVLFGHQHIKYNQLRTVPVRPTGWKSLTGIKENPIHFYCCPSTSECDSKNGYYLFEFDENQFTVKTFEWNETVFELASSRIITLPRKTIEILRAP